MKKKMNPKVKKKRVKALRSGEYCQTAGQLVDEYGYCCLGVLAEECGEPELWKYSNYDKEWVYSGSVSDLRKSKSEFNLSAKDRNKLMDMNDSGKSFEEIADWIEENL